MASCNGVDNTVLSLSNLEADHLVIFEACAFSLWPQQFSWNPDVHQLGHQMSSDVDFALQMAQRDQRHRGIW